MFNVEFEEVTNQFCAEFDTVVHTGDATLGEKTITQNGVYNASSDDLDGYSEVTVNVPTGGGNLQSKSVSYTPTESAQSEMVTASPGYDGLSSVEVSVGAISSTYVGSGVTRKAAASYTPSESTQTIAANQYLDGAQTIDPIPSQYIVPTGAKSITANGQGIDVASYATANVNVPNSYSAGDEGKVVDNGELVAQTSTAFTQNGTYDTTTNNEVVVNVSGGVSLADLASGAIPVGEVDITGLSFIEYAFARHPNITSVVGSGYFDAGYLFDRCAGITKIHISLTGSASSNYFANCTNLKTAVVSQSQLGGTGFFNSCSNLETVDLNIPTVRNNYFVYDNKLATIILRKSDSVTSLENISVFSNTNHFKSGGSGGIIYIPKALYDHLGDGTALDYKATTNWSTIDGYGTITWAKIEGSIYETQYADGTPISA